MQSSIPLSPVITITDDMMVGGFEFRRAQPKRNLLNRVRCRFIDPRQAWTTVDGPIRDRPDWQDEDGDLYEATYEFPWTADHRRAQRLQKAGLLESRLGRNLNATIDTRILGLKPGQVVRFDSKIMPRINGIYRISEIALAEELSALAIQCNEYNPDIERDWNPEIDEQDFELPELEAAA